jgi:endonuclease YncB( thermonuclease family)
MINIATIIAVVALLSSSVAQGAEISGVPLVVDGDTIEIGTIKIRLEGIDAPETDQICLDQNAATWTCGIVARDRLAEHIEKPSIDCNPRGTDKYARTLAVCTIDGEDLNAWMVRQGLALAFIRYSRAYVAEEE